MPRAIALVFVWIVINSLSSCKTISNRLDERVLDCGPEVDSRAYSVIFDPFGKRIKNDEIEVVDLSSSSVVKGMVSSKGCLKSGRDKDILVKSRLSEWALTVKSDKTGPISEMKLRDFAGENVRVLCEAGRPIAVNRDFSVQTILSENVSESLKNAYKISYKMYKENQTVLNPVYFSLSDQNRNQRPFSPADKSGDYKIRIVISNLLRKTQENVNICDLKLDSTPPDVDFGLLNKAKIDKISVHNSDQIALVRNRDNIVFSSKDQDLSKVEYCLEELNDDFENSDETSQKNWINKNKLDGCSEDKMAEIDVNKTLNVDKRSGFWSLRFRGLDRLSNVSVWKKQSLLFYQDDSIEVIQTIGNSKVTAAILEKKSLDAVKASLEAFQLFRELPTRYERSLASNYVLSGLLRSYEQSTIGVDLLGLDLGVKSMAISRDDKLLFVGSYSANFYLFDLVSGKLLQTLKGVTSSGATPTFNTDGTAVYFPDYVGGVSSWDIKTNLTRVLLDSKDRDTIDSIALSKDGALLNIAYANNSFEIVDGSSFQSKLLIASFDEQMKDNDSFLTLVSDFSFDGERLVSNSRKSFDVLLWSTLDGRLLKRLTGHQAKVLAVKVSDDGKRIFSVSDDKTIRSWNVETGENLTTSQLDDVDPSSVQIFPNLNRAIGWNRSAYRSFYFDSLRTETIELPVSGLLSFSKNADRIIVGSGQNNFFGYLHMFIVPKGFVDKRRSVSGEVVVAPDHSGFALFDEAELSSLRDLKPNLSIYKIDSSVAYVASSKNGQYLITIDLEKRELQLRDLRTGKLIKSTVVEDWSEKGNISINGDRLLVPDDNFLRIYDLKELKEILRIPESSSRVLVSDFSIDGQTVFGGFSDGSVRAWNSTSGVEEKTFKVLDGQFRSLALSPDGKFLLGAGLQDDVMKWSISDGKVSKLSDHRDEVRAVRYALDGKLIISGGRDKILRLWEADTNVLLARIPMENIVDNIYSGPSKEFVTKETGGNLVRIWSLDINTLSSKLCSVVKNYIDPALCKNIPTL